ncbi:MAG: DNA polymerase IV [Actinomycetota bacterium]
MSTPTPILHVDMDAFYASVEAIKNPDLADKPVVVGGQGGRGVVTSASYAARAFGIRSAMPMVVARRLCPVAAFVPNDFPSYQDYSTRIRRTFETFTPLVEPLSLDEAFLDVSGSVKLFGEPATIAVRIKREIKALGLDCTVGVAPNKFLAKLASDAAKPDGLMVVDPDRVADFLHPLPVRALWGVGEQTGAVLERLGLRSVGDIARLSRRTLERAAGDALGAHLYRLARGIDDRPVVPAEAPKSIGSEETYPSDLDSAEDIVREILRLSDRTASRLRAKGMCGRTVTLKLRYSNFQTITRSRTLEEPVDVTADIYRCVRSLYLALDPQRPRVRLLGVSISGLIPGPPTKQLDLLPDRVPDWVGASEAIDAIRQRFGKDAVGPATLLEWDPYPGAADKIK